MKIKVQVVIESDTGKTKSVENIACLERQTLRVAELGLTLAEVKDLLESMQQTVVEQQVAEYLEQQAYCSCCGKKRRRKGNHNPLVYRTLFGKLRLQNPEFGKRIFYFKFVITQDLLLHFCKKFIIFKNISKGHNSLNFLL
ncbi:MAG: hypothetical protein GY874_09245 [Desulfobacteraceae bacterium]|nr:hypothetical protein [Desulfobacteraceae bacterium]